MSYSNILDRFPQVCEAYIVVGLFEVYIGSQKIKIKIKKDLKSGKYSYSNNYHYQGSDQAGPYTSSLCVMLDSESEALANAIRELTSFYDKNDTSAKWIKSENF